MPIRRKREPEVKDQNTQDEKMLDVNATMQGTLRFDDPVNLRINGKFEGTLDTKGYLMIGDKATIKANITGESISIEGNVNGNIKVTKLLKLGKSARLNGDVETPALSVQEGAVLTGQIRMEGSKSSGRSINSTDMMNIYQLAKYLEVDRGKVSEWVAGGVLPGTKEDDEWMFEKSKIDEWVAQGRIKA